VYKNVDFSGTLWLKHYSTQQNNIRINKKMTS